MSVETVRGDPLQKYLNLGPAGSRRRVFAAVTIIVLACAFLLGVVAIIPNYNIWL